MECIVIEQGAKPIYQQGTGPGTGKDGVVIAHDDRMSWIKVRFVDKVLGVDTVEETFGDSLDLEKWAALRIASLTLNAQTSAVLANLSPADRIEPADLTPSQAFLDEQAYRKVSAAAAHLRAVFGPDDKRTIAAVAQASDLYKPAYIGL